MPDLISQSKAVIDTCRLHLPEFYTPDFLMAVDADYTLQIGNIDKLVTVKDP